MISRLKRLQQWLHISGNDGIIITKKENIHYLTGIAGLHPTQREAVLLVKSNDSLLFHSIFLDLPPSPPFRVQPMNRDMTFEKMLATFFHPSPSRLVIEGHNLIYNEFQKIKTGLPETGITSETEVVEKLRHIKDKTEIDAIAYACKLTAQVMQETLDYLATKPDISEKQMAYHIESRLMDLGADGMAFPPIVGFNDHSASPHHLVSDTKLTPNAVVLLDFGCAYHHYASDMTRTICLGRKPARFKTVENTVMQAYQTALQTLKPSHQETVVAAEVDQAARQVITAAGFGPQFIHTTGHALGLEIHEQPSLSTVNQTELLPGMVITLEPGIYLSGKFGYRYENTVYLSPTGPQVLT